MIKVNAIKLYERDSDRGGITLQRAYKNIEGFTLKENMNIYREADYLSDQKCRYSEDNGRTWTQWEDVPRINYTEFFGDDERLAEETGRVYNPTHKHYVYTFWTRYLLEGHESAYIKLWRHGERAFFDHQYIAISDTMEGPSKSCKLVKYEEGAPFSREDPRNPEHLTRNRGFLNAPIVLKNGDIAVPVSLPVYTACERLGLDVNEVFPSCPQIAKGVMVARGVYNEETGEYDFRFSNPGVISDLRSSRGIDEPIIVELKTGSLLLIMRGSNMQRESWHTRIADKAPGYKWASYSDDGGKTFTSPEPWTFDDGEPVYSSATISKFIRSSKNGKLYWIGNVTDKEKTYANFPRYPLHICEVDEERAVLKKDTLTVIDTKREGESDKVQLSNFTVFEDRETFEFEVCLTKCNQIEGANAYFAETWKYRITVD